MDSSVPEQSEMSAYALTGRHASLDWNRDYAQIFDCAARKFTTLNENASSVNEMLPSSFLSAATKQKSTSFFVKDILDPEKFVSPRRHQAADSLAASHCWELSEMEFASRRRRLSSGSDEYGKN